MNRPPRLWRFLKIRLVKGQKRAGAFIKKACRVTAYFRPYRGRWLFLFVIANFSTALSLINPLIMKLLIDNVLVEKNYALLNAIMIFFITASVGGSALGIYTSYFYDKLKLNILFDVRNELFSHLEKLDAGFFQKKKLGDILTRLTVDISGIEAFISLIFNTFIVNLITFMFIVIICFSLDLKLTLIAMIVIPAVLVSQRYYGAKIRKQAKAIRKKGAGFLSFLQEKLSAVPLIQLFTREDYELKREKGRVNELIDLELKYTLTGGFSRVVTGTLIFASLLFVLWYGSHRVISGALTIGAMVAIYTYIAQLFGPVGALTGLNAALQNTLVSVDRVFAFLDTEPKITEKNNALPLQNMEGRVAFRDVCFGYDNSETILEGINFEIKSGEKIGLVGPSGVGKTTIIELICRLYDPTKGSVEIDGTDIKNVTLASLRQSIGVVSQDIILFRASIRENIAYAKLGASSERIRHAAKLAHIDGFIMSLPHKYRTNVAERGLRLSGGERQRIAIARAILKDPKILIFDEFMAALDSESEREIQKALNEAMKNKTTFIIAHKLSTLQSVDRIFVIKEKKLAEEGTFSELLAKKGYFYGIYNLQFGGSSHAVI